MNEDYYYKGAIIQKRPYGWVLKKPPRWWISHAEVQETAQAVEAIVDNYLLKCRRTWQVQNLMPSELQTINYMAERPRRRSYES